MYHRFINYIKNNQLLLASETTLLTISGGVDSMVMLHLFAQSPFPFVIAHCNFQLRGQDADDDEMLVKQTAEKLNISFYSTRFETKNYAEQHKISIQMAARELRYEWFDQLAQKYSYHRIATAHHQDDVFETFFVNMLRKTGIKGLRGIKPMAGNIIRPLLFASKKDIEAYAATNNVLFREDKSNKSDYYARNYIRHHIIPSFRELQAHFDDNMMGTIDILSKQETVYAAHIQTIKDVIMQTYKNGFSVDISKLQALTHAKTYLFEFLYPFGFNASQIDDIFSVLDKESGKIFFSDTYRILKDRHLLVIEPINIKELTVYKIEENFKDNVMIQHALKFELLLNIHEIDLKEANHGIAYFDAGLIRYPLCIRKWKQGDVFYPFGMKGKKKLSDYFSDSKLSLFDKDDIDILCNANGDILWIVGMRSDNRYRITTKTTQVLKITQCQ